MNNDTTTSQKANADFVSHYDLATRRSDWQGHDAERHTGKWVTGGWGASSWTKDYDGTLTLPANTTFEHFHRCGAPTASLSTFIFYSTNDTLLYTRIFGTEFTTATQMAVPASSHAVCVGTNENFTFVYSSSTGASEALQRVDGAAPAGASV